MKGRVFSVLKRSNIAQKLATGVVNQALLSGVNFVVGLLLIRYGTDRDYGLYVLSQSALLLLMVAQSSFVGAPISIMAPKMPREKQLDMIVNVGHSLRRFITPFFLLAPIIAIAAWAFDLLELDQMLVAVATVLAGWTVLSRDYLRGAALVQARPELNLIADLPYSVILLATAAIAAWMLPHPAAFAVAGLALAGAVASHKLRRGLQLTAPETPGAASSYWRQMMPLSKWAAIGALSFWVFAQGSNYVLAATLDIEAVAAVNAARLLLMPAMLLTIGIKGQLLTLSARWLSELGLQVMLRRLTVVIFGIGTMICTYVLVLWLFRDWITHTAFRKTIPDLDALLLLWSGVTLISMTRDLYQSGLMAQERLKPLAWFCVAGSVVSVSVILATVDTLGARGAVIGLIAAEGLGLIGVLVLTLRAARRAPVSPTVAIRELEDPAQKL